METLEPCGYIGITETECMTEFKCCYDLHTEVGDDQHCFKPAKPNNDSPEEMTFATMIAISVGAALGVLVIGGEWYQPFWLYI